MKKVRWIKAILLTAVFVAGLTACAKKENTADNSKAKYDYNTGSTGSASAGDSFEYDTIASEEAPQAPTYTTVDISKDSAIQNSAAVTSENLQASTMEKIIRNVDLELETQDFDDLIAAINDEITRLGGYIESSDLSGRRYDSLDVMRRGNIIARIPKEHLDEFVGTVNDASNVVNKTENTKNVTLQYVDAESHIKALEIEQDKLYELLGKTGTLEDILTLESRLSSIRYELENYKSQLRIYDNQVEYSTVTLRIEEVERMTPKEEEKVTVFKRIKTGFSDTMYDISEGIKNVIVGFTVNLPYIIIWAVIILVCILLIRKGYKKLYKAEQKAKGMNTEVPPNNENKNNQ
jgi:hypothetical protein